MSCDLLVIQSKGVIASSNDIGAIRSLLLQYDKAWNVVIYEWPIDKKDSANVSTSYSKTFQSSFDFASFAYSLLSKKASEGLLVTIVAFGYDDDFKAELQLASNITVPQQPYLIPNSDNHAKHFPNIAMYDGNKVHDETSQIPSLLAKEFNSLSFDQVISKLNDINKDHEFAACFVWTGKDMEWVTKKYPIGMLEYDSFQIIGTLKNRSTFLDYGSGTVTSYLFRFSSQANNTWTLLGPPVRVSSVEGQTYFNYVPLIEKDKNPFMCPTKVNIACLLSNCYPILDLAMIAVFLKRLGIKSKVEWDKILIDDPNALDEGLNVISPKYRGINDIIYNTILLKFIPTATDLEVYNSLFLAQQYYDLVKYLSSVYDLQYYVTYNATEELKQLLTKKTSSEHKPKIILDLSLLKSKKDNSALYNNIPEFIIDAIRTSKVNEMPFHFILSPKTIALNVPSNKVTISKAEFWSLHSLISSIYNGLQYCIPTLHLGLYDIINICTQQLGLDINKFIHCDNPTITKQMSRPCKRCDACIKMLAMKDMVMNLPKRRDKQLI